jgi:hypothetical protein
VVSENGFIGTDFRYGLIQVFRRYHQDAISVCLLPLPSVVFILSLQVVGSHQLLAQIITLSRQGSFLSSKSITGGIPLAGPGGVWLTCLSLNQSLLPVYALL